MRNLTIILRNVPDEITEEQIIEHLTVYDHDDSLCINIVNGIAHEHCQFCHTDYPCDSAHTCHEMQEAHAEMERLTEAEDARLEQYPNGIDEDEYSGHFGEPDNDSNHANR